MHRDFKPRRLVCAAAAAGSLLLSGHVSCALAATGPGTAAAAPKKTIPVGGGNYVDLLWQLADSNDSGELSAHEAAVAIGRLRDESLDAASETVKKHDSDGDGFVTRAELRIMLGKDLAGEDAAI